MTHTGVQMIACGPFSAKLVSASNLAGWEHLTKIRRFSYMERNFKIPSVKWRPICLVPKTLSMQTPGLVDERIVLPMNDNMYLNGNQHHFMLSHNYYHFTNYATLYTVHKTVRNWYGPYRSIWNIFFYPRLRDNHTTHPWEWAYHPLFLMINRDTVCSPAAYHCSYRDRSVATNYDVCLWSYLQPYMASICMSQHHH